MPSDDGEPVTTVLFRDSLATEGALRWLDVVSVSDTVMLRVIYNNVLMTPRRPTPPGSRLLTRSALRGMT